MSWGTLSFEERQRQWLGHPRYFRQHHGRKERPWVWDIQVAGARVFTRHGLLDGMLQSTDYVGQAKNVGKVNAITAEQDALAEARRDIRKKVDFEGYDEYVLGEPHPGSLGGWVNIDRRSIDISVPALLTNLPGSFCLYKPENNLYDQKGLLAKAKDGKVLYTLKRDGLAYWVVVDYYGQVQFYSRRSRAWNDKEGPTELPDGTLDYSTVVLWAQRFPHLVEAVKKLNLPPGTMLACELTLPGEDNFPFVSGLTKGYTARALEDMQQAGKWPSLYWWDVPFYGGQDLASSLTVRERYSYIQKHWTEAQNHQDVFYYLQPIQYCDGRTFRTPEAAEAHAKDHKLEGWVVVDPDAVYGDKAWNLKGKPDRPASCAKLKPRHEDDFIALWDPEAGIGTWGTGKHEFGKIVTLPDGTQTTHGGVGSVALYQHNTNSELVYICDCSSGMTYDFQARLQKQSFPLIWQCEYVDRTYISDGDKTNALRFPTFVRVRSDKRPEECSNDRL